MLSLRADTVSGPQQGPLSLDLDRICHDLCLKSADTIFLPTATPHTIAQILEFLVLNGAETSPAIHALLRYDSDAMPEELPLGPFEPLKRALQSGQMGRKLFLWAETEALASHYTTHSGAEVNTLHHNSGLSLPDRADHSVAQNTTRVQISYLGDGREEKGFHLLPGIIDTVLANTAVRSDPQPFFSIQIYWNARNVTPRLIRAAADLRAFGSGSLSIFEGPLGTAEYEDLVLTSDIILLPYSVTAYSRRGSGVLVDALVAGKIVIAPKNTWIGHQAEDAHGLTYEHESEIASVLLKAIRNLADLRNRAAAGRLRWQTRHSSEEVIRRILAATADGRARLARRPTVVHIAPMWLKQGSTFVFNAQLAYLRSTDVNVLSVYINNDSIRGRTMRFSHTTLRQLADVPCTYRWVLNAEFSLTKLPVLWRLHRLREKRGIDHATSRRRLLQIPATLRRALKHTTVDAVIVNYIYNVPLVAMLGLKDVPTILETHDIQTNQLRITNSGLDVQRELAAEAALWQHTSALIAINRTEAETMARHYPGERVHTIYPPAKQSAQDLPAAVAGCFSCRDILVAAGAWEAMGIGNIPQKIDLLFVGSNHPSNVESLRWFLDRVFFPHLTSRGINLVVAGTINKAFGFWHKASVRLLGEVIDMAPLYAAAKCIVVVVVDGTGLPIKTIETLSLGKCFAGNRGAFRGLPLEDARFPLAHTPMALTQDILTLLGNSEARRKRAAAGWAFAWPHIAPNVYADAWDRVLAATAQIRPAASRTPAIDRPFQFYEWNTADRGFSYLMKCYFKNAAASPGRRAGSVLANIHSAPARYAALFASCCSRESPLFNNDPELWTAVANIKADDEFDRFCRWLDPAETKCRIDASAGPPNRRRAMITGNSL
jgi:hypothetical protein